MMEKCGEINDYFHVISDKICSWRRFGRLLGLQEYELNNIELGKSTKYERLYKCLEYKNETAKIPIGWGFLKEKILKFKEGGDIVNTLEQRFPALLDSINEQNNDQEADIFIDIFDIISMRLQDWKQLARVLGLKVHVSIEIEGNDKYKDHLHEKIYRCIYEKKTSAPEWLYWRNILLEMKETDLIDDIEEKYPELLQDKRIDISNVAHQGVGEFGIVAHDASNTENFKKLKITLKESFNLCIGGGREKVVQIEDMHKMKKKYFEKYKCVEKIQMYNFTNIGKYSECKILQTLYKWLKKNNDDGFCVKGYDAKQHLEFITDDYKNENPKESCILAYSKTHGCILFIDTEPVNIKTSMRKNRSIIRPIRSANQCLDNVSFVFIPLTLYDPDKHQIDDTTICKACIDLQLVIPAKTFEHLDSFEKWWDKFSNEVDEVKSELEEGPDVSNDFFRNIMTHMAVETSLLPSFTINPENEIKEVQKLIMLTPEQQDIVYSKHLHKIIKGPFGSGKTVVAQKILKLVANCSKDLKTIYYIMHDTDSGFVKEMEKLAIELNKEDIKVCKRSDLIKENSCFSSILEYLLAVNKGKIIQVFIEEFNAESLNKSEVEKIKILLENEEFKNSHIVLVAQSMESERSEMVDETFEIRSLEAYNYKKLVEETDFEIFHLSYLMRSSKNINDIVNATIPILEEAKMKSFLPKFDLTLDPSNTEHLNDDLKEGKSLVFTPNVTTKSEMGKHDESYTQESKMKDMDTITSYDDTGKFLKYCTIGADKYSSKREIESSYKFIGDRLTAHHVKGKQPVIYYPFKEENKDFGHQIFCLAEVLQKILNGKKEQAIICLDMDSMNMVKKALQVNSIKWTNDSQLMSKSVCLLTDYTAVRGCEFMNVVLIYPSDEQYLKQNLVGGINRCIFDLKFIVLNKGVPDDTLVTILSKWIDLDLVNVSNDEDYLKNVHSEKLKIFKEINQDILNTKIRSPNMDITDGKVIQKLKSFGEAIQKDAKLQFGASEQEDGRLGQLHPNDVYSMNTDPRGLCVIINNKDFEPSSGLNNYPRVGTDVDANTAKELFQEIGYIVESHHNQTVYQMRQILKEASTRNYTNFSSFCCIILSHGQEGVVYGVDGTIDIRELTAFSRGSNLSGKPKLFLFEADRGTEYMDSVERDGDGKIETDLYGNEVSLPSDFDFVYGFSTLPGYYSWRNSQTGSWFIQAVVAVFREYAHKMDVVRMLERVNRIVATKKSHTSEPFSDNKRQLTSIVSNLRKRFYLFPVNGPLKWPYPNES